MSNKRANTLYKPFEERKLVIPVASCVAIGNANTGGCVSHFDA